MSRTIIGWISNESWRQLKKNYNAVYLKVDLQDPENYGFTKVEINISSEEKTTQDYTEKRSI